MRADQALMSLIGAIVFGLAVQARQSPPQPVTQPPAEPVAPFHAHTVTTGLRGGYQVLAADLNKDDRIDLVGLGSQIPELIWYENPSWTPHVITRDAPRMVNMDAADVDGDGIPELAIAYGFTLDPARGTSRVGILTSSGDPRELWTLKEIDSVPTAHRARFIHIDGKPILIHAPILGPTGLGGTADPDHTPTPMQAYRPPDWKRETVSDENRGVVHDLLIADWDGDGRQDLLTAGYQGVFVYSLSKAGTWFRTQIVAGDPSEWPKSGASEVAVGRFNGKRFFVTNEPFHGNQVVVYQESARGVWPRNVIDTRLNNSHALTLIDADGDGNAEIVSGGTRGAVRGAKPGVFFYKAADSTGQRWERMMLDATIAANACVTADFNSDRKMDIACIDNSDPWALRWYENARP